MRRRRVKIPSDTDAGEANVERAGVSSGRSRDPDLRVHWPRKCGFGANADSLNTRSDDIDASV